MEKPTDPKNDDRLGLLKKGERVDTYFRYSNDNSINEEACAYWGKNEKGQYQFITPALGRSANLILMYKTPSPLARNGEIRLPADSRLDIFSKDNPEHSKLVQGLRTAGLVD